MKAQGELLINGEFVVYKDTMKSWEPPHNMEVITQEQIDDIINNALFIKIVLLGKQNILRTVGNATP